MIHIVNRNLKFDSPERENSSSYKCAYKDTSAFEKMQINISYKSEHRIYEVESQYLNAKSKSIHFKAEKKGDSFDIVWSPKSVISHIHRIQ